MVGQALSVPRSLDALFDVGVVGDLPDGQLLERFTTGHRESAELAFRVLVDRHGPMVSRICRRLLDDPNDAEDAFQATFLVLVRGARTIREQGSVAAWLHGVAVRVASRGRVESARRRRIERHGIRRETERNDDPGRLDLASLIDEELTRLPEKYRAPIVLCYLEGLTHEGAANVSARSYQGVAPAGRPRSGSARRPRPPSDDRGRPDLAAHHRAPLADVSVLTPSSAPAVARASPSSAPRVAATRPGDAATRAPGGSPPTGPAATMPGPSHRHSAATTRPAGRPTAPGDAASLPPGS